jgi:hypothetical protein
MFCEDCGYENETRAKYCIGCGKKIEAKPPQITVVSREFPFQPKPLFIFIGIAIIASLYLLPINHEYVSNSVTLTLTTSDFLSACNTGNWNCPSYLNVEFYLLWLIGLGFIIFGIFQKKTQKPLRS